MTTRLSVQDLLPNTAYAIRVRAVGYGTASEWSTRRTFTTISDNVLPNIPTGATWAVVGNSFHAEWNAVVENEQGDDIPVTRYEVELVANSVTKIVSVTPATGSKVTYDLSFEANKALFGTARPSITFRVRAVDNKELKSAWSPLLTATNAVPSTPTNVVAVAGTDLLSVSWTDAVDDDIVSYRVHVGTTTGFTPSDANKVFEGKATSAKYVTTTYSAHYFKVAAVDEFGQVSGYATSNSVTPESPFTADTTPPSVPTALAGTIANNANGIGARATLTWTQAAASDLAGFYIRYRKVGDTTYSQVNLSASGSLVSDTSYSAIVELQAAHQNYEFQIKSYDWSYNESAWTATTTVTSPANAAPANVTGLTGTPGKDAITYKWDAVADTDIKNYEVTFSTSSTFASGNITYLTGTSTSLTVSGLATGTTYYARVRAVDNGGLASAAWSATNTSTTGSYPLTPLSDGSAPASSPTPAVTGGIGNLFVTWPTVSNADPVTYEVHVSTTTGFTPSGSTKVAETASTIVTLEKDGAGANLAYGTTYYVKIVAKDRDGSAAASAQGSGSIAKVTSVDSSLTAGDVGAPTVSQFNTAVKTYSVQYAVNSSESTPPAAGDASWSTATPTRTPGTFIWTRTVVTYQDNSTSTTNPALLTGNTGATGPQGSQGIPGPAGADGQTLYTWIKYADTPTTGMSDSPTGKTYMGIAYNKTSATESATYSDYEWSLVKGEQGIQGPSGSNGESLYTWVKYGTDANGAGMSDDPTGKTYIGLAYNKTTATESTTATDYAWSLIQGPQGNTGNTGTSVTAITPYYATVATGAAAPTQPTNQATPPAPWQTTEPNYTANTELYRTDQISYSDSTYAYTTVTKVSAYTAATTAITTANGKNKITHSTGTPGTTANTAGDTWFQYNASEQVIGQWRGTGGTSWVQETIENTLIANLDAAKITTGLLNAARVQIGATSTFASGYNPSTKNQTFVTNVATPTTPTAVAAGDIWVDQFNSKFYRATAAGTGSWTLTTDIINISNTATKNLWGHPSNTTLIDGGDIYTNSIKANSLTLSDFTNYVVDGDLTDTAFLNWSGGGVTRTAAAGTEPAYISWTAGNGTNVHIYNEHSFEVRAGEKYYVYAEVSTPASNTVNVNAYLSLHSYDPSGATVTWPQLSPKVVAPNSAWTSYEGTITIPAGASTRAKFDPFAQSTAAGQVLRMRRMVLRKMHGGELIVDGSVTATKMVANTITAASGILADAVITTAKIADLAVSTAKIADANITTAKIADANITNAKIADLAVTNAKIANATITDAKIGDLSVSKLTAGTVGNGVGITMAAGSSILLNGGHLRSNTYNGAGNAYDAASTAGFYLGNDGLRIAQGSVSANAFATGTLSAATITMGTNGIIQTSGYNGTSGFKLDSTGLSIPDGSLAAAKISITSTFSNDVVAATTVIDGGKITTGIIESNGTRAASVWNPTTAVMEDVQVPAWRIDMEGDALFGNVLVQGNLTVGQIDSTHESVMQSANFIPGEAGWQLRSDGTGELLGLSADSIDGRTIKAGTLEVDTLANGTLSQTINVKGILEAKNTTEGSPGLGSSVSLSGHGFYVKGPDSLANPVYVEFPTNGAPNIISGSLQASTLSVSEGATLRKNNALELDSEFVLNNQVNSPIGAPTVQEFLPFATLTHPISGNGDDYDANFAYADYGSSPALYAPVYVSGSGTHTYNIEKFSYPSGAYVSATTVPNPPGYTSGSWYIDDLTFVGGYWYFLIYRSSGLTIHRYNQDFTHAGVVSPTVATYTGGYTLGNDGTDIIFAGFNQTNEVMDNLRWKVYSGSTLAQVGTEVVTNTKLPYTWNNRLEWRPTVKGVFAGNFDYGVKRFLISHDEGNGNSKAVYAFDSAGIRQTQDEWPLHLDPYDEATRGFTYDPTGQRFIQVDQNLKFFEYGVGSGYMWPSATSSKWWASYSWRLPTGRTVAVGTTSGSTTVTDGTNTFRTSDVGADISGSGIPTGATIVSVAGDGSSAVISVAATATASSVTLTISYETAQSPKYGFTKTKRRQYKITGAVGPEDTVLRYFVGRGDTEPAAASSMYRQGEAPVGIIAKDFGITNFSGPTAKSPGTFAAGKPARIYSQQTDSQAITNVSMTSGSVRITISPASNAFMKHMVGARVTGTGIPDNTFVAAYAGPNALDLTTAATSTGTARTISIIRPRIEFHGDGFARIGELLAQETILTSETAASTAAGNTPPLRIGDIQGTHLRVGGGEIIAMASDNTRSGLNIIAETVTISPSSGGVIIQGGSTYGTFIRTINSNWTGIVLDYNAVSVVNANYNGAAYSASNLTGLNCNNIEARGAIITHQNIRMDNPTLGSFTANVNWNSTNGFLRVVSSSKKFKENIHDATIDTAKVLELVPRTFQRNDEWTDDKKPEFVGYREDNPYYIGFIAEEAEALGLKDWVEYDGEGRPVSFAYANWGVALQAVAREQRNQITDLQEENARLTSRLDALESSVAKLLNS